MPAIAVVVALGARLWALQFEPWVTVDGTEYIRIAQALARGHTFPSLFPPGYPALVALAHAVIADRVAAATAASVIAGALLPWPVWALARHAVGPRWAALPAFAAALHPMLIEYATVSMSESAYVTALYGALALAAGARALPAGLSIGAAFAIRPEALLPAAALAVRQVVAAARRSASWRVLALGAVGFLILAIPCWLYFHAASGAWTLTPKLSAFRAPAASWREEEARLRPDTTASGAVVDSARAVAPPVDEPLPARIATALQHYPANALAHGRSVLLLWPLPVLALSLWGLVRRRAIESIPLLHLAAIPLLGLSEQPRFVLAAVPALAILATIPLARTRDRRLTAALGAAWLAGTIWCGAGNKRSLLLPFEGYAAAQKQAGEWLGRLNEDGPVMDRRPHLAFYADLSYRVMPELEYDALLDYAVRERIRYLVLDEGLVRVFRPQLKPLIYDQAWRDRESRVEMIYAGGHFQNYGVMIFRVLQPSESKTGAPPVVEMRWRTPGGAAPTR